MEISTPDWQGNMTGGYVTGHCSQAKKNGGRIDAAAND